MAHVNAILVGKAAGASNQCVHALMVVIVWPPMYVHVILVGLVNVVKKPYALALTVENMDHVQNQNIVHVLMVGKEQDVINQHVWMDVDMESVSPLTLVHVNLVGLEDIAISGSMLVKTIVIEMVFVLLQMSASVKLDGMEPHVKSMTPDTIKVVLYDCIWMGAFDSLTF